VQARRESLANDMVGVLRLLSGEAPSLNGANGGIAGGAGEHILPEAVAVAVTAIGVLGGATSRHARALYRAARNAPKTLSAAGRRLARRDINAAWRAGRSAEEGATDGARSAAPAAGSGGGGGTRHSVIEIATETGATRGGGSTIRGEPLRRRDYVDGLEE